MDITYVETYTLYMPRIARVVAAGYPHHITQRRNYQQKIFADDTDQRKYLSLLKQVSPYFIFIICHSYASSGSNLFLQCRTGVLPVYFHLNL